MTEPRATKAKPLFIRADYMAQSRILIKRAALMDGRASNARLYRKLAAMLVFADIHMPKHLPVNR